MKKYTLVLLSAVLLISIYGLSGCSREVNDDDMITGKWIETKILLDTLSTQCEKQSFIEFSEYKIALQDRVYSQYHACVGEEEFQGEEGTETRTVPPFTEILGNYSIKRDTLVIKDVNNITHIYIIDSINSEIMKMKTLDRDGNLKHLSYRRFTN